MTSENRAKDDTFWNPEIDERFVFQVKSFIDI